jgi:hypothetical protein
LHAYEGIIDEKQTKTKFAVASTPPRDQSIPTIPFPTQNLPKPGLLTQDGVLTQQQLIQTLIYIYLLINNDDRLGKIMKGFKNFEDAAKDSFKQILKNQEEMNLRLNDLGEGI